MAVVTKYGTGYKDPAALKSVSAVFAEGMMRAINSQIAVTNGDSIASIFYVGRIPSNAILSPAFSLYAAAIAGLTSFSLGFAGAPNALMNAVNIAAGGAFVANPAVATANLNQQVWQTAGLASDPGGFLDIFATLNTAATATGVITFHIPYAKA